MRNKKKGLRHHFYLKVSKKLVWPCNCNCNYILFTKLPWPGDSEVTFRSSSQAATCPSVYLTRRRLHTTLLIAERQEGKLWIPIFIVFGLTRPGIEPESTASVAYALSTRPLIGNHRQHCSNKHSCNKTSVRAREHRGTLPFSSRDAPWLKSWIASRSSLQAADTGVAYN